MFRFYIPNISKNITIKTIFVLFGFTAASAFKEGYIIGGEDAEITDWPFMVSLQSTSGSHFCGGVLMDATHVLTAGHCVDDGVSPYVFFYFATTFTFFYTNFN